MNEFASRPPKSSFVVTDELIQNILSSDEICRGRFGKHMGWPLLEGQDLLNVIALFRCAAFSSVKPLTCDPYARRGQQQKDQGWTNLPRDSEQAWRQLDPYSLVDDILLLGRGHLVVAGGSVAKAFYGEQIVRFVKDYDFFFVGYRPDQTAEAEILLAEVLAYLQKKKTAFLEDEDGDFEPVDNQEFLTWNEKAVTVNLGFDMIPSFQLILRLYPATGDYLTDISLPIGGFDLHSCAVLRGLKQADGAELSMYGTLAGAFSLGLMINVLMTSRMSTSMVPRLSKYMKRGFDVYYPGTTREKMRARQATIPRLMQGESDYCDVFLPHLVIKSHTGRVTETAGRTVDESDYEPETVHYSKDRMNFKTLLRGKPELFVQTCSSTEEFWQEVGEERPLQDYADELQVFRQGFLEWHVEFQRRIGTFRTREITLRQAWEYGRRLRAFVREEVLAHSQAYQQVRARLAFLEELVLTCPRLQVEVDRVRQEMRTLVKREIDRAFLEFVWLKDEQFERELERYFERMSDVVRAAAQRVHAVSGLQWNTQNPLTQLTASNNPTVENPRSWWGEENYVSFRVGFPDHIFWLCKQACLLFIGPTMGKSIFKDLLLGYFVRAWADSVVEKFLGIARLARDANLELLGEIADPDLPVPAGNVFPPGLNPAQQHAFAAMFGQFAPP